MRRIPALVLLAASLLLASCTRSADPLDWKLKGERPAQMQAWFDENLPLMPDELAGELAGCVEYIRQTLPPARTNEPLEKANYFCNRLNGKTVREVLTEGHELAVRQILARISVLSSDLLRTLKPRDNPTEEQQSRLDKVTAGYRSAIDRLKEEQAKREKRLEELRAPVTK